MLPLFLLFGLAPLLLASPTDAALPIVQKLFLEGKYVEAETSLKPILTELSNAPYDNPARYAALKLMYQIHYARQGFETAEPYLQEAINFREVKLGSEHPDVAADLVELANLLQRKKEFDRAVLLIGRVMSIHRKHSGPKSAVMADDWTRLAQINFSAGRSDAAVSEFRAALAIREELEGADSVNLLPVLEQLGSALTKESRYDEAEPAWRRALLIRERLFGPDAADVLPALEGLAYVCFGQKKYLEAEPSYQRILNIWKTSAGADHPMVALTLDKIAVFYRDQQRESDATAAVEEATAVRELFLANALSREASVRIAQGKNEEAVGMYERALGVLQCRLSACEELRASLGELRAGLRHKAAKPRRARPARGSTLRR